MKLVAAVLILCLAASPTFAEDWTTVDTTRQAVYSALHVADWLQTRYIAQHPAYYETNPILGKHPSVSIVDLYFVGTLIAHAVVSNLLEGKYRHIWQYATTALEATMVGNNYRLGIKFGF